MRSSLTPLASSHAHKASKSTTIKLPEPKLKGID